MRALDGAVFVSRHRPEDWEAFASHVGQMDDWPTVPGDLVGLWVRDGRVIAADWRERLGHNGYYQTGSYWPDGTPVS